MNAQNSASGEARPDLDGAHGILDSLADGLYITDTERRIVYWNAAAERITGWPSEKVVGKSCFANILVHVDKDGHQLCGHEHCPLHRSIVTGAQSDRPMLVFARHRDGRRIPVEVSVAPVRDGAGRIVGGVESFRDLSDAQRDLLRAQKVQELALRWAMPDDARVLFESLYQPCDMVGGDFMRLERVRDSDTYAALIVDIVGHGVAAALNAMFLRVLWDEHRDLIGEPAALLGALNRYVWSFSEGQGYFGTAVAAVYDAASGRLRLGRAGHPAPFVVRSATGSVVRVGESDPALGLLADTLYSEFTLTLETGDSIVLLSDGAEEAPGPDGQELGGDGLAQLIRESFSGAGESGRLERLERSLLNFTGTVHLPDDLTLLLIERRR